MGVKGTRRARVRARCEFLKRETDQVRRNDLQGGRRRKEVAQKLKEKRESVVREESIFLQRKDPSKTMKEKRKGDGRKGVWGERRWTKRCGLAFRSYIRPRDPNKPGHSNFLLAVRENQTSDKASNDSSDQCLMLFLSLEDGHDLHRLKGREEYY